MQSNKQSMVETLLNVGSGVFIAYLMNVYLLPLWGVYLTKTHAIEVTVVFTIVSMVRSYTWRRIFNNRIKGEFDEV